MILKKQNSGFTLLEIIVVLAIFIILALISSDYITQGLRSITFGYEQDTAVQNARRVMNQIIEEIREASQSDLGDYLLATVEPQNFSFYSNIDDDLNVEKVRYFLDGGVFKKGLIEPSGSPLEYLAGDEVVAEVAQDVNNQSEPIFRYYDTDNNIIADPPANIGGIRLINISLKINVTPEKAPQDYYVNADIQIRNLKDNL